MRSVHHQNQRLFDYADYNAILKDTMTFMDFLCLNSLETKHRTVKMYYSISDPFFTNVFNK